MTYAQLEERANRLAAWLIGRASGPATTSGCYLYNGTEYVEAMLAAFKLRAVPINVNYRYVEDELRYLFNDADLKAVIHDAEFTSRVDAVRDGVPTLAHARGRSAMAATTRSRAGARRPSARWSTAPATTTTSSTRAARPACPKGVVWRQADAFYACFGGGDYSRRNPVKTPEEMPERIVTETGVVFFPLAPLMHGAAQWTVFAWLFSGGTNVLTSSRPRTDYAEVWRLITEHKVQILTIIGDAVARPLIDEYLANPGKYDASSLFTIGSGGAPLSPGGRAELAETFPHVILADGYGASETGAQASSMGDGRFSSFDNETIVLNPDTLEPIVPGLGRPGARRAARPHPARVLQRSREDGGHVRRTRRRALGAHR